MNHKKSITIHNLDETLSQLIEQRAKEEGNSLNKTIKDLLRQSLGVRRPGAEAKKRVFDDVFGTWSEEEAREFEEKTKVFERIDPEDWK